MRSGRPRAWSRCSSSAARTTSTSTTRRARRADRHAGAAAVAGGVRRQRRDQRHLVVDRAHTDRVIVDGVPVGTDGHHGGQRRDKQFTTWVDGDHWTTVPLGVPTRRRFLKTLAGSLLTIVVYSLLHPERGACTSASGRRRRRRARPVNELIAMSIGMFTACGLHSPCVYVTRKTRGDDDAIVPFCSQAHLAAIDPHVDRRGAVIVIL